MNRAVRRRADVGATPADVLLLHGLWMGAWAMSGIAHALRSEGFGAEALAYHSVRGEPDAHLERLAAAVRALRSDQVHLVGHSMGGVLVLRYLHGDPDPRVRRAVLLGTPALGCQAAAMFERQPWAPALLGASARLWHAKFPARLETRAEVGAIAGNRAFGLGALFVTLPPPSDGVVTVAETRIPGLADHLVLPVSHTGMLFSRVVACQTCAFLRGGKFER